MWESRRTRGLGAERARPAPAGGIAAPGTPTALLVAAMVFPSIATWLWFVVLAGRPSMQLVYAAVKALQFGLPAIWVFCIERRPTGGAAGSARSGRRVRRGILEGAYFGAAAGAAILAVYFVGLRGTALLGAAPAGIREKVGQLGLATPGGFLVLALFYSLIHSGLEEYYWRWFVFGRLRARLSARSSIALSSLAFTAHHVIVLALYFRRAWWMTLLGSAAVWAGGAVWARIYERNGSLAGPWSSHLLVDAALMTVGFDMIRSSL